MTTAEIIEFEKDMLTQYDVTLQTKLSGGNNKIAAFANRVEMIVDEEIKANCPNYLESELETLQTTAIWNAKLEQAFYLINNYDMTIISGVDPQTGQIMPIDEIRKRAFSPMAKKILSNAGLFYSGIGAWNGDSYGYSRRGWR
jgi:hypothetical protein